MRFCEHKKGNASINEAVENKKTYHPTPKAEWINHIMNSWFDDLVVSEEEYDAIFNKAEVMLGLLSTDCIISSITPEEQDTGYYSQTYWFGRSTRRRRPYQATPVKIFDDELNNQGTQWPPLKAGLFGGSEQRAAAALKEYGKLFDKFSREIW